MGDALTIVLRDTAARNRALAAVRGVPDDWVCTVGPETRTQAQNRLLWPLLTQIRREVRWFDRELSQPDWKNLFVASLRTAEVVPTLNLQSVMPLGLSTKAMRKDEFSDLLEVIYAFGAERGVQFPASPGVEALRR